MQKVIKRTILAERQAARRLAKRKAKLDFDWRKSNKEQVNYVRQDEMGQLKTARFNRRDDYELGPLAPKRDVGDWAEKWGTINSQRSRGQELSDWQLEKILEPWGGKGKKLLIRAGDRVVLLEGRDKGKIGVIKEIDEKRAEATVKGLNQVDVAVPTWMMSDEDPDKRPIRTVEKPVSLSQLRLVHRIKNKDVIVKQVVRYACRGPDGYRLQRKIAGLRTVIPWPKEPEEKEPEDQPDDTLRIDVETKTFVPTLLTPPMPRSVIDELRNKYSAFRTRHDPEYIAAKMDEERLKEEKKKMVETMRTPRQELLAEKRKKKEEMMASPEWQKRQAEKEERILERVGKFMAKKQGVVIQGKNARKKAKFAAKENGESVAQKEGSAIDTTQIEAKPLTA